jgi:hypothetical protein
MCSRHRPLNGADSEELVGYIGPLPFDSQAAVMSAFDRCRHALAKRDVGGVVLILRELNDPERDALEDLLLADDPPEESGPARIACPDCLLGFPTFADLEGHACHPRGQALVEMALILPVMLLLIVGVIWTSLYLLQASRFDHLARESATAGAYDGSNACSNAEDAFSALSAPPSASFACSVDGEVVTVTVSGNLPIPPPADCCLSGDIEAVGSAIIREGGTPAPSPSEETP